LSNSTPFSPRNPEAKTGDGHPQAVSRAKEETTDVDPNAGRRHRPPEPISDVISDPRPSDRSPSQDAFDAIDARSDMTVFMSPEVRESLRRQALRKWFHLPEFNRRDGLDDYDGDFREFNPLGKMVTAHMKHQMQRAVDRCDALGAQPQGQAARPLPAEGRRAPAVDEGQNGPTASTIKIWAAEGESKCMEDYLPAELSRPETALLWDAARCAHGQGALSGCTRCRDACSGGAIFFDDDDLQIRPANCSGRGTCAAVCPTGALRPAEDEVTPMLEEIRALAGRGEDDLSAIFCTAPMPAETLQHLKERLPGPIVTLHSQLPAAPGPEAWLAALALGACRVISLGDPSHPVQQKQVRLARAILAGFNLNGPARLLGPVGAADEGWIDRAFPLPPIVPATWKPAGEKRALLWQAIDHLYEQVPGGSPQAPLPAGAPLGEVCLDATRCTLCMACVGVCPTGALRHAADRPQVRFRERDCIQCGLCRRICPEQAVTLSPRVCYDRKSTRSARVLHQAEALNCSVCGTPFASRQMIDAITRKLTTHWMYLDPSARERLHMCRDCRIRSIYETRRQPPPGGGTGGEK
jgi:ferredoxin